MLLKLLIALFSEETLHAVAISNMNKINGCNDNLLWNCNCNGYITTSNQYFVLVDNKNEISIEDIVLSIGST